MALTIGGIDDKNLFDHREIELWHSNYGETVTGSLKPEVVAPSIWVVAPMIPGTPTANEAIDLFRRRSEGDLSVKERMAAQKYVTPHYQHVDGTSFAAPLTSSVIACALEANPGLPPIRIRALMRAASRPVAGAPLERQGAGVLDAGQALALAVWDRHDRIIEYKLPPLIRQDEIHFFLHDLEAKNVEVLGSWDSWKRPGLKASHVENGVWKASLPILSPGRYSYGFLIDEQRWMDDPANRHKEPDPSGVFNSILTVPEAVKPESGK
jgi:serine protease AprX